MGGLPVTPSAPASFTTSSDGNPRYYSCATADCLLYGANRNAVNPQNIAEDKDLNTKVAAGGIILGVPLAVAAGGPALFAMGAAAQTTPMVGGIAGVEGMKWASTILVGSFVGGFTDYALHPDASPASIAVASAGGAIGGVTKFSLNAAFGLANQLIPTTLANIGTALAGSQVVGRSVTTGLNQTGDSTSGGSWWTSPVKPCGPIYPRTACK